MWQKDKNKNKYGLDLDIKKLIVFMKQTFVQKKSLLMR